jgi:hypothetical protein
LPRGPHGRDEDDVRTDASGDRLERRRPFERVAVVEERDVPVLDEVAAEDDIGPGTSMTMSWSVWPRPRKRRFTSRPPTSMVAWVAKTRSGGSMTISRRSSAMPGSSAAIVTFGARRS